MNSAHVIVLNSLLMKFALNVESHQNATESLNIQEASLTQCASGTSIARKDLTYSVSMLQPLLGQ